MNGAGKSDSGKKKALIVTTVSGFVPQFEMNNVRILQELGYEVHYASNFRNPGYGNDNSRLAGTGIRCHQIDLERSPFRFHPALRAYRQLKALLEREHFELIHCHTPMGGAIGRLAAAAVNRGYQKCAAQKEKQEKQSGKSAGKRRCGKTTFCVKDENKRNTEGSTSKRQISQSRVIYTAHGFHFYRGAPLINWLLYYPAERWLARYTDVLITINGEDYKRARRFRLRNSGEQKERQIFRVNGVGIDLERFGGFTKGCGAAAGNTADVPECSAERAAKRQELGIGVSEFLLFSVGELTRGKNHRIIIRALAELLKNEKRKEDRFLQNPCRPSRRIIYAIAGEGKERRRLEHLIRRKSLEKDVKLLGYRSDIRELLLAADCFIFPSRREGMPVALMEAIASGVPCIAADIRGCRELLDRNQLVRKNRVQEYCRAMERLCLAEKQEKKGKRGSADRALQSLEEISSEKINQKMKRIYMHASK